MVTDEGDDELALFHEMQRRENEKNKPDFSSSPKGEAYLASSQLLYKREDLLASDAGKNDYNWLLTPPGTPLMTVSEYNSASMEFKGLPNLVRSLDAMKIWHGRSTNTKPECLSRVLPSKFERPTLYTSTSAVTKRVSSCSAPASRPALRNTQRSTTPTRGPVPSSGISAPLQNTRLSSGSSTPSKRPLQQPQSPQPSSTRSCPAVKPSTGLPCKGTPSRGSSPTVQPRAPMWEPSSMPGFSLEPPPNLRTSVSSRSLSSSRGASVGLSRPSSLSLSSQSLSSSSVTRVATPTASSMARMEPAPINLRARRQSCSPNINRVRSTPERQGSSGKADSSPVVKGNRMVEKLIQSRRAAASSPSLPDVHAVPMKCGIRPTTPTKKDVECFGRNTSRKSMDLALQHVDLRQSASNGLRSIAPSMYPPSFYTVRSVSGRGLSNHSSNTTTSSTASSEHSMSFPRELEGGSEMGDEVSSDVGSKASPMSLCDSVYSATKDVRWTSSPSYRDDSVELMKLCRQRIRKCQHGGGGLVNCKLCTVKSRLQSLSNNTNRSLQHSTDVSKGSSPLSTTSKGLSSPSIC